ncbi:hypothetical protein WME97_30120 [Sorangium sp. So ce367]|uniref:hypothetical protein n=1 Tax=Sorangium sp. So ce367 TaxID=3133305 RepID=UPI003F61670C
MKLSKVLSGLAGLTLAAASLAGCIVVDGDDDHDHVDDLGSGSLAVTTAINGISDARQCADYDVDLLAVRVESEEGFVYKARVNCEEFGATFDGLGAGYHDVDVWLEDFDGDPRSDVVRVPSVDVIDGMDTLVDVDFPSGSIYR